mgnify:CR=1 FL=1
MNILGIIFYVLAVIITLNILAILVQPSTINDKALFTIIMLELMISILFLFMGAILRSDDPNYK